MNFGISTLLEYEYSCVFLFKKKKKKIVQLLVNGAWLRMPPHSLKNLKRQGLMVLFGAA